MITRTLLQTLRNRLDRNPAVALLGARQVGKTTLAWQLAEERDALYLDLESPADLAKLADPELFLGVHQDRLVVLDEVQRLPSLFPVLRTLIDQARRKGRTASSFLLLGSASLELLTRAGESLAGRIAWLELTPLLARELESSQQEMLWQRGGFPGSLLADTDTDSMRWRLDFIRSYLEGDFPRQGRRLPAETLRRFWTMLAHQQGGPMNAAALARSLGLDVRTVNSTLDLLVDLLLVRRLQPWHTNQGKRLVKSPKIYLRDSGLVHALLGLGTGEAVLGHPVAGASWEGFVIENILAAVPESVQALHYRTAGGAEVDLVLQWPGGDLWMLEIKRSLDPRPRRGFHQARLDLSPVRSLVVYPGTEAYPLTDGVEAIPLAQLVEQLQGLAFP